MKCKNCGSEIKSDANFCRKCGTEVEKIIPEKKEKKIKEESKNIELTDNIDVTKIELKNDTDTIEENEIDSNPSLNNNYKTSDLNNLEVTIMPGTMEAVSIEQGNQEESAKKIENILQEMEIEDQENTKDKVNNDVFLGNNSNSNIEKSLENDFSSSNEWLSVPEVHIERNQNKEENEDTINKKINSLEQNIVSTNTKKESKSKIIIIIVLIGILILSAIIIFYLFNEVSNKKNKINKLEHEKNEIVNTNNKLKEESNEQEKNKNALIFNGYQINLDEYKIINNSIKLEKDNYDIKFYIGIDIDYKNVKNNLAKYRTKLTEDKYDVSTYGTKIVENQEYVVYEVKKDNNNFLIAYTSLENEDVVAFIISNNSNTLDYDSLKTTNEILKLLKKDGNEIIDNNVIDFFSLN